MYALPVATSEARKRSHAQEPYNSSLHWITHDVQETVKRRLRQPYVQNEERAPSKLGRWGWG